MNDMSAVIVAKSDQWNADDFAAGPRTFTIEDVAIRPGTEQPVQIKLAGSDKFFRPCKTVSRVLVAAWGADANTYRGRSLTLYTDPGVTWGGMKVGGIRVSHMSDLERPLVIALQEKKGSRKMTTVQPLKEAPRPQPAEDRAAKWAAGFVSAVENAADLEALDALKVQHKGKLDDLTNKRPELAAEAFAAFDSRAHALSAEKRTDEQHGDQHTGEGEEF
ncbi:hypothetical protein [Sphingomonas sp.]|uniref:hypothetical protein n=1 Tax=Sphingomonas sp. TaxID=28214 RepID=UPI002FDB0BA0